MNNAWFSFSVSDVGKKRSVNQDSIYSDDAQGIWVVADGMGGHRDGDKASQAIVRFFKDTEFSNILSERILQIEKISFFQTPSPKRYLLFYGSSHR